MQIRQQMPSGAVKRAAAGQLPCGGAVLCPQRERDITLKSDDGGGHHHRHGCQHTLETLKWLLRWGTKWILINQINQQFIYFICCSSINQSVESSSNQKAPFSLVSQLVT